jgi:hypothetical protein
MQAGSPVAALDPMTIQIGASVAIVHVLEWIKKSDSIPWISAHTKTLNIWLAAAAAFCTTIGVTFVVNGSFWSGGAISFQMPPGQELITNAVRFVVQLGAQKAYYKIAVQPSGK